MDKLIEEIEKCNSCPHKHPDMIPIPGNGNPRARVLIVGEQPPEYANYCRSMFSGPAGSILKELITVSSLDIDDIYITSLLKCTLPADGGGVHLSLSNCLPFTLRQIETLNPLIICPLGGKVTRILTENRISFSVHRGNPVQLDGRIYFPLFHPSEVFYNYNIMEFMERDIIELGKLYRSIIEDRNKYFEG